MSRLSRHQINNEYFEWLYNHVCEGRTHEGISYIKLFTLLHEIEFTFTNPRDVNRAIDGTDLRYRYSVFTDDDFVMTVLNGPCSVLEMMVALAIRCEETIMDDTEYGNRTLQWFWGMMDNLGISYMDDDRFDENTAVERIYKFLDRDYEPDGKGGLFHIRGCEEDLRDVEIWVQLCWYLDKFA